MKQIVQEKIGKLREYYTTDYLTINRIKSIPITDFGIKLYRGLRRDLINEFNRQIEIFNYRQKNKLKIDPLILMRNTRLDRIKRKFLSYSNFSGNTIDRDRGNLEYIADYDSHKRMALIRVDNWCNYSRSYGTYLRKAGLVLYDNDTKQYRFLRVGPDIENVEDALEYIKPAAVKIAESRGKKILRQGDVYFIPQRQWNLKALRFTNHKPIEKSWGFIIEHPHHPALKLKTPHKAVQQILAHNGDFGVGGGRSAGHAD